MSIVPIDNLISLPRRQKQLIVVAADAVIAIISVALSYFIRIDSWAGPHGNQWILFAFSPIVAIPVFYWCGCYRTIFRFVSNGAIWNIARASAIYCAVCGAVFTLGSINDIPRSLGFLQPLLLFVLVTFSRITTREMLKRDIELNARQYRKNVLIYGAGLSGRQLGAALSVKGGAINIVGFIDDDDRLHGNRIDNLPVYGPENLGQRLTELNVEQVLLAIPSATRTRRGEILEAVRGTGAQIRVLPDLADLAHGKVTVNELRELSVEDLLGRDPVPPVIELFESKVRHKIVLVTGAGGSIGSELCRQIIAIGPRCLVLVEANEFGLYSIERELQGFLGKGQLDCTIVPVLANVTDPVAMRATFEQYRPHTVYHAAAYKHVPLVEQNEPAGVCNNTFGTMRTALAAENAGVSDFVLISTDKAVRPTSVMGTSKRLAEMVLQALAQRGSETRFSMVRFGNVLGSSGSVVPLFQAQIRTGGPITITHPDITRYFMTIPEAAQLVIQAGAMARGGEVFVLDMGEPVRIVDLAQKMIDLSGMTLRSGECPDGDIEIRVVGLREGEKLYEELLIGNSPIRTHHPRIMMAMEPVTPWSDLQPVLDTLIENIAANDSVAVRAILMKLVPDFTNGRQSDAPNTETAAA